MARLVGVPLDFPFEKPQRRRRKATPLPPRVPHRRRVGFKSGPVRVTLRIRKDAPRLRRRDLYAVIRRCMRRSGHRDHFRICQYSIQGNHVHLICEADHQVALSRGIQGFASAMARRINKEVGRRGTFFDTRYHMRPLRTPVEVRRALSNVLNNWRCHHLDHDRDQKFDPYSSAELFAPWGATTRPAWLFPDEAIPIAEPRTSLLREEWMQIGEVSPFELPGQV